MSNFKIVIDAKSFFMGLAFCSCFILFSGFNSAEEHDFQTGRYQVVSSEYGDVIIDSETGEFVIATNSIRRNFFKHSFDQIEKTLPRIRK